VSIQLLSTLNSAIVSYRKVSARQQCVCEGPSEEIYDNQRKESLHELGYKLQLCLYLHSYSSCFFANLRNPAKFSENSNLQQFKVIDRCVDSKARMQPPITLVINSNIGLFPTVFKILTF